MKTGGVAKVFAFNQERIDLFFPRFMLECPGVNHTVSSHDVRDPIPSGGSGSDTCMVLPQTVKMGDRGLPDPVSKVAFWTNQFDANRNVDVFEA